MEEEIKKEILRDLVDSHRWNMHTELRNLKKGLPLHLINTKAGKKAFEKALKDLVNYGWLIAKKSTGEIHVHLNNKFRKEILGYIQKD